MGPRPKERKILRAAVAGMPRIVEVIAALPAELQAGALTAAERGYRQTFLESGVDREIAGKMVAALVRRLRRQVDNRDWVREKVLQALHDELCGSNAEPKKDSPRKAKRTRRRLPKSTMTTETSSVQDSTSEPATLEDGLETETAADPSTE
jgi:hypothetical protein